MFKSREQLASGSPGQFGLREAFAPRFAGPAALSFAQALPEPGPAKHGQFNDPKYKFWSRQFWQVENKGAPVNLIPLAAAPTQQPLRGSPASRPVRACTWSAIPTVPRWHCRSR